MKEIDFLYEEPMLIFPTYNYFYCDMEDPEDEISGITTFQDNVLIFTGRCTFLWREGMADPMKLSDDIGCICHNSIQEFEGKLIWLSTNGFNSYNGSKVENISFEKCVEIIGAEAANYVRDKSTAIFAKASEYAKSKGMLLADTKFEWGIVGGKIILIDEVLTPDSSRFWPADKYEPGRDQESFDKQFVRNYLESINFNKSGPGVELPDDIVRKTSAKYIEGYERLTGKEFV